jgi:argininosuccinate lyase
VPKLWGGRFAGEADALAYQFNASIGFDQRLWQADIQGSQAWAAALAEAGVISQHERQALAAGLDSVFAEFAEGRFDFLPSDEDIHTAVERRLSELVGAVAGKLHTGRSRNDQVATDFRLWVMQASDQVVGHLWRLQATLVDLAERHAADLMPGYTHWQRGQPITFGHWVLSHWWALERDVERWAASRRRAAVCPLGSSALAGTAYPVDRTALATALGFERAAENSVDAVSDRDFAVEFVFNAALLGSHLSRLAEALVMFSTTEFGFVSLADAYASGSSLMPQKKNPDVLELTRGKAGTLLGYLTGLLATLKGLASAYDKDLQEDKPPVFAAFDALDVMLPVLAGALGSLTVHTERMAAALDTSVLATELADYLVKKGVPFRDAHHLVGQAVQLGPLDELTLETLKSLSPAFDVDVHEVWDFRAAVDRRKVLGGTAPASVHVQIAAARQLLNLRLTTPT